MYPPATTALRMAVTFSLLAMLLLHGVVALFGGVAAILSLTWPQIGKQLILFLQIASTVFVGALVGASLAGPARRVGWKSALAASLICFIFTAAASAWYDGHLSAEAQYPPKDHMSSLLVWIAGNAMVFAFAVTRLKGVVGDDLHRR